eukprot:s1156_g19.t1
MLVTALKVHVLFVLSSFSGIRGKLQDALAIQGEQEQGDPEELGNQARRLRLASVIRNPGFWDLCSMLGSIQSLRLQLEIRRLRQHVRQLTEDWAAEHPDEFEALKDGSQELQETFQQILQAAQLTDAALLLEAAVDQELQRVRTEPMAAGSSEPVKTAKAAPPENRRLSKPRAVALQNELLAAYTSARFQKKLQAIARQQGGAKMGSLHRPDFQAALKNLLRKPQMDIISRYGFQASEQGIEEMEMELEFLEEDGDVYVNKVAIEEALFGPFEETLDLVLEEEPNSGKPSTKQGVYLLLRSLPLGPNMREAWFQEAILKLQHKKDAHRGDRGDRDRHRPDPDGYFHLPGRAELALEVQQKILPRFGFDATKDGIREFASSCGDDSDEEEEEEEEDQEDEEDEDQEDEDQDDAER